MTVAVVDIGGHPLAMALIPLHKDQHQRRVGDWSEVDKDRTIRHVVKCGGRHGQG